MTSFFLVLFWVTSVFLVLFLVLFLVFWSLRTYMKFYTSTHLLKRWGFDFLEMEMVLGYQLAWLYMSVLPYILGYNSWQSVWGILVQSLATGSSGGYQLLIWVTCHIFLYDIPVSHYQLQPSHASQLLQRSPGNWIVRSSALPAMNVEWSDLLAMRVESFPHCLWRDRCSCFRLC